MVTSVGLSAPATCAAIRAGVTNPVETRFADRGGEWIMAHEVPLQRAWRGLDKLAMMAVTAIDEALAGVPPTEWRSIPMILCIAEDGRPGRSAALDDRLFLMIEAALLGLSFRRVVADRGPRQGQRRPSRSTWRGSSTAEAPIGC